jgi:ferritin
MSQTPSSGSTPLNLLVREIEATPPEYWQEILATLRQFREHVTQQKPQVVDVEQRRKNQAAIDLLRSWVEEGNVEADTQAWETLKTNLDADRLSDRPLFP